MTIAEVIMVFLGGYSESYRTARRALAGLPPRAPLSHLHSHAKCPSNTLKVTLSRLKRRGLVQNDEGKWGLTVKGKKYIQRWLSEKRYLRAARGASSRTIVAHTGKKVVVVFDIPEIERWKRGWLRRELRALGFTPLQRSVWLGPAPLPKDFIRELGELNLLQYLKFFKATTYDIV